MAYSDGTEANDGNRTHMYGKLYSIQPADQTLFVTVRLLSVDAHAMARHVCHSITVAAESVIT